MLTRAAAVLVASKGTASEAQSRYSFVRNEYDAALRSATRLADTAAAAEAAAAASTALLVQAMRPSGSPGQGVSAVDVLFGGEGESLLNELSTVEQLNKAHADLSTLAERAERDNVRAAAARKHADQAMAATRELPIDAARSELDAAQQAVTVAAGALDSLRATSAASTVIEALPALPVLPVDDGRLNGALWTFPGSGPITDGFGLRPAQPAGAGPFHYAIDIGTGCNAWILAAGAGTVTAAGPFGGLGNRVVIDHGQGVTTTYAHIVDGGIAVTPGQPVAAGAAIALSGSTGISTGCHLHFEVTLDGVRTDPLAFLAARGVVVG